MQKILTTTLTNQIQDHIKIIQHNQVAFFGGAGIFQEMLIINIICPINRLKESNHIVILVKPFNKIHH